MEVHFSQRLILGEWSWSLHRATENVATVPVKKCKNGGKKKCIKIPSVSQCTQPVSATSQNRQRGDSIFCSDGPLMEGSTCGVSPQLKQCSLGRILEAFLRCSKVLHVSSSLHSSMVDG